MQELQLFMKPGTKTLNFLEDETGQMQHGREMLSFCKYPPPPLPPSPHPHPNSHPHPCAKLEQNLAPPPPDVGDSQLFQMEIRPPEKKHGQFEVRDLIIRHTSVAYLCCETILKSNNHPSVFLPTEIRSKNNQENPAANFSASHIFFGPF
jgi:hypothetical protein